MDQIRENQLPLMTETWSRLMFGTRTNPPSGARKKDTHRNPVHSQKLFCDLFFVHDIPVAERRNLLLLLVALLVDDVVEAELVDTLGGGDNAEPVTELLLLEVLLGPVGRLVLASMPHVRLQRNQMRGTAKETYRYLR